jgi:flagellin-like hook-associated protein FlgL
MGGRNAEMTFGIGKMDYSAVFGATRTIDNGLPNAGQLMNLTSMPSDAVVGPTSVMTTLTAGKIYEITKLPTDAEELVAYKANLLKAGNTSLALDSEIKIGSTFKVISATDIHLYTHQFDTLRSGHEYEITALNGTAVDKTAGVAKVIVDGSNLTADLSVGDTFTTTGALDVSAGTIEFKKTLSDGEFREIDASRITRNIESVQKKINTGRVQAGSQYAALESAVIYTTDLTAQYELGYNTVHDVNFSMETAHLAKNQILQQAATAMLAQANQGQQGLLQLIQG